MIEIWREQWENDLLNGNEGRGEGQEVSSALMIVRREMNLEGGMESEKGGEITANPNDRRHMLAG